MDLHVTTQQFVILSKDEPKGSGLPVIGSRREILDQLSKRNTMPEHDGDDVLYGPGICIQLPPDTDPIIQMLITITEEEIAWQVIDRAFSHRC